MKPKQPSKPRTPKPEMVVISQGPMTIIEEDFLTGTSRELEPIYLKPTAAEATGRMNVGAAGSPMRARATAPAHETRDKTGDILARALAATELKTPPDTCPVAGCGWKFEEGEPCPKHPQESNEAAAKFAGCEVDEDGVWY